MNDCQHYEAIIAEKLFGDPGPEDARRLEAHVDACPACRALLNEMEAALQVAALRSRPEPPADFWEGYYGRLEARMRREGRRPGAAERLAAWLRAPGRLNLGALALVPRWTYRLSGAVALLAAGVLIGWLLFGDAATEAPQIAREPAVEAPAQPVLPASLDARAGRYLERSRVLLMGLVNLEPEQELSQITLARRQQVARELIDESSALKDALHDADQARLLRALIEDLEVILLQIANLEAEYDLPAIEMVQRGVDRRAILLKINVAEMRRAETEL